MKRFTDTAKWAKSWFQDLAPHHKCLWLYLCDAADPAGVWDTNWKLASVFIGKTVTEKDLEVMGDRVRKLPGGKYGIVSFIEFQYGKLSKDCKAHIPIFRAIEKHSLSIPYPKAIHSLQEEEKEEEEETVQETEAPKPNQHAETFARFWAVYPKKEGKGKAEESWKTQKCAPLIDTILAAVERYKACAQWKREGGQFIPHPSTWLNQKRWEDEPLLSAATGIRENIKANIISDDQ